jgi:hypothetical protein
MKSQKIVRAGFPLMLVLLIPILSCNDVGTNDNAQLSVLPVVRVSQTNYQQSDIQGRVPDTLLLNAYVRSYKGCYSDDLKSKMIAHIENSVCSLGLSLDEFQRCLAATGQQAPGVVTLPYLAERANYTGKPSWILEFTWGMTANDLGHHRCFVMEAVSADTLLYITCR